MHTISNLAATQRYELAERASSQSEVAAAAIALCEGRGTGNDIIGDAAGPAR